MGARAKAASQIQFYSLWVCDFGENDKTRWIIVRIKGDNAHKVHRRMSSSQEAFTEVQPSLRSLWARLVKSSLLPGEKHLFKTVPIKEHNNKTRKERKNRRPDDITQCLDATSPEVTVTAWVVRLPEGVHWLWHFSYTKRNYVLRSAVEWVPTTVPTLGIPQPLMHLKCKPKLPAFTCGSFQGKCMLTYLTLSG